MVIEECCKCHKFHSGVQCEQDRRTDFAGYAHDVEIADLRRQLADLEQSEEFLTCKVNELTEALAEVTAERDRLFELAYPDGPAGDAVLSCKRHMEILARLEAKLAALVEAAKEVARISDRKHDAWDALKEAIDAAEKEG